MNTTKKWAREIVLSLLNAERKKHGLRPISEVPKDLKQLIAPAVLYVENARKVTSDERNVVAAVARSLRTQPAFKEFVEGLGKLPEYVRPVQMDTQGSPGLSDSGTSEPRSDLEPAPPSLDELLPRGTYRLQPVS